MRVSVTIEGDIVTLMTEERANAERAVTRGIAVAGEGLQSDWRAQIATSGLGARLARTIRRKLYPETGVSLRAASLVWSNASRIVGAFDRGVLIRSKDGFYLAIPTAAAGSRGLGNTRITPGRWEQRTGQRLRFVYRRRGPSLLVADNARLTSTGRAAPKRGRRRADGILTGAQTIPIFLLVPQVRLGKRLDIDGAARAWQGRLPGLILANWPDRPNRS